MQATITMPFYSYFLGSFFQKKSNFHVFSSAEQPQEVTVDSSEMSIYLRRLEICAPLFSLYNYDFFMFPR